MTATLRTGVNPTAARLAIVARALLVWLRDREGYLIDVRDKGEAGPLDTSEELGDRCDRLRDALLDRNQPRPKGRSFLKENDVEHAVSGKDAARKRQRDRAWAAEHPEAKREAARRYRAKRAPGKSTEYNRAWREKNLVVALVSAARRRAKRDGLAFDPSITEELREAGVPTVCPIYGTPIVAGSRSGASPSLDRVVPSVGYVRGNVRIVSWLANRHKNDASAAQHEAIARYMRETMNGGVSASEIR